MNPEFRLLAACSYLDESSWSAQRERVLSALDEVIDPDRFALLVKRHRLQAIAYTVLRRAAKETGRDVASIETRLAPIAKRVRICNLPMHAEWLRLQQIFMAANIPLYSLKGTALSKRLYADPGMRHSRDIDLFVAPENVTEAVRLLEQCGYCVDHVLQPEVRRGLPLQLCRSLEWHISCRQPEKKIHVELHWRFERIVRSELNDRWIRCMQEAEAGGPSQLLFDILYCSLHGAEHGWMRLKWLGDVRMLAGQLKPCDWVPLLALARELRMQTVLAETLLLLNVMFELPLPRLATELIRYRGGSAERRAEQALHWMSLSEEDVVSPALGAKLRTWRRHCHLHGRHRFSERVLYWLAGMLFNVEDMRRFQLAGPLLLLYPFIRPFGMLGRAVWPTAAKSDPHAPSFT